MFLCRALIYRVVHCQSHLLDHCFHMSNPLTSNYQSILHWFQLLCLWSRVGQFQWEKILHLMFCWHFSQSLSKVCNTPCKPNQETGQINLDLSVKSVLLTGYLIWFAGSIADFTQWLGKMSTKHQVENLLSQELANVKSKIMKLIPVQNALIIAS